MVTEIRIFGLLMHPLGRRFSAANCLHHKLFAGGPAADPPKHMTEKEQSHHLVHKVWGSSDACLGLPGIHTGITSNVLVIAQIHACDGCGKKYHM